MNQATRTHLFPSAVAGDPTMALVFIERNLWVQLVSMKGQTVQITNLDHEAAAKLGDLLLSWAKPIWWTRVQKWENTARQATAELRKVKEELRCAHNRTETYRKDALAHLESRAPYKREIKKLSVQLDHQRLVNQDMAAKLADVQAKLAQALDRSAIVANDYIQLRKVAEHNEKVMDQAIGEMKRMAKEAGIELPTPAGQLAAYEVSPPAKPLAYLMPPCKEKGNTGFRLYTYPEHKCVFDTTSQDQALAEVHRRGYDLLAPWDRRHPINLGPVPAYPAPEEGSSEDVPVRGFAKMGQSAQQRPGNLLHIKEVGKWGRYSWALFLPDGTPFKPQRCDGKFPSIEQAIQWCKRHDFDYRY